MSTGQNAKRGIIFSTAYFPFVGGAEVAVREITGRLPGYEWDLITARLSKTVEREERIGAVLVHRVGIGSSFDKFLLPFLGLLLACRLHRAGPFVVAWSMMASQASVAAAFFKMLFPCVRLTLTLQEGDEEEHLMRYAGGVPFLYRLFIRPWHLLVFKRADHVTAISRYLRDRAIKNGVRAEVEIVPNGVDLDRFVRKAAPQTRDPFVLVTTSRLVTKNDPESVIRALASLPASVHFWIIGQGAQEESLKALSAQLGLEGRVFFLGHKEHEEIVDIMSKAHVFIRPSLSEGLGNSFLEAMALGLPIIGTPVGGITDFLIDGQTGIFCAPKNPESIAAAVQKFLDSPHLVSEIGSRGQRLVQEGYRWETIARAMEQIAFNPDRQYPRVLLAASIFPPDPGGPATHAKRALEGLAMLGFQVRAVSFRDVRHLPKGVSHFAYFIKLLAAGIRSDVIYAYDAVSAGFPAALAVSILRSRFAVRIGGDRLWEWAFERGITSESMGRFYESGRYSSLLLFRIIRFVLRRADVLVVPSEQTGRLYERRYGVPRDRISVLPNPISPAGSSVFPYSGVPLILFASRLARYKNLSFVVQSLAHLRNRGLVFRFVICGDGPERERIDSEVRSLGLKGFVELPGSLPQEAVDELTRECAFALAPALTEFHPNYLMKAMSYGKPFLISRDNALPFAVPEAFLFDPRDREQFEKKIEALLSEGGYREAQAALSSIHFSYSWDDVRAETARILKNICAS